MATTPKTGSRSRRGRASSKPATIDLKAKDVSKASADKTPETKTDKPAASTAAKSQAFGRDAAKAKSAGTAQSARKSGPAGTEAKKEPAKTEKAPEKKPESAGSQKPTTPPAPAQAKSGSGSGLVGGLVGACLAIAGLGAIGQMDGASNIPFLGKLYQGGSTGNSDDQIALLNQRIDELSKSAANDTGADNVEISALTQKVDELQSLYTAQPEAADTSRINELDIRISELSQALESVSSSEGGTVDLTTINDQISTLQEKVAELDAPELAPIEQSIASLQGSLQALDEKISKNAGDIATATELAATLKTEIETVRVSSKVAKSVAINAIGTALQNDDPLGIPISSLEALGGPTEETIRLSELAREGIPTIKQLDQELDEISGKVQNPAIAAQDGGSITDKLWANARSLVTVRSRGPREGDSAAAVLSRIKANLNERKLDAVEAEWKKLPPEVATANQAWIAKVQKRTEAMALYQTISDQVSNAAG